MKTLANNLELYEYLLYLASELKRRGLNTLSEDVDFAARQASSLNTEFLGESKIALKRVSEQENGMLTQQEREDLLDVLKQLEETLGRRK